MPDGTTDPRPWWHLRDLAELKEDVRDLGAEVERRDRDLAERIDAHGPPGIVVDRLARVEAQQERDALFLRRLIVSALVAIPTLSALLDRALPGG